jgi:hypothetical protein
MEALRVRNPLWGLNVTTLRSLEPLFPLGEQGNASLAAHDENYIMLVFQKHTVPYRSFKKHMGLEI